MISGIDIKDKPKFKNSDLGVLITIVFEFISFKAFFIYILNSLQKITPVE